MRAPLCSTTVSSMDIHSPVKKFQNFQTISDDVSGLDLWNTYIIGIPVVKNIIQNSV